MRVTIKGQVTIPQIIREKLGIVPNSDVEFVEEGERIYILKKTIPSSDSKFNKFRGSATVKMSTDEIMSLTRGH